MSRRRWVVVPAAVLVASMTGCSLLPGGDGSQGAQDGARAAEDVLAGKAAAVDPGKTIVKTTFDTSRGSVDIGVIGLDVRGKLAYLSLSLTPHIDDTGTIEGDTTTPRQVNGDVDPVVSLIDAVNLKRYKVVADSGGRRLGAENGTELKNGKASALVYVFAAPPQNVRAVDVAFGNLPPFRDVPVRR